MHNKVEYKNKIINNDINLIAIMISSWILFLIKNKKSFIGLKFIGNSLKNKNIVFS